MKKEKLFNNLKFILVILVVFGHVGRIFTSYSLIKVNCSSNFLDFITKYIYGFHMPLFIFVSGAIYSICVNVRNKYKDDKKFIKTKFKRLIIPYIFVGLFILTPTMILFHFTDRSILEYVIKNIMLGTDPRHLWFLSSLFIIFIIFHFFRKINNKFFKLTFFIICFFISFFRFPSFTISFNYIFYFYIGYLFEQNFEKICNLRNKVFITIILFIYTILIYLFDSNTIISCLGILSTILLVNSLNINIDNNVIIKESMGIYLFHPIVIYILTFYLKNIVNNVYMFALILFFSSIIISILISKFLKKVKLQKLIGEK